MKHPFMNICLVVGIATALLLIGFQSPTLAQDPAPTIPAALQTGLDGFAALATNEDQLTQSVANLIATYPDFAADIVLAAVTAAPDFAAEITNTATSTIVNSTTITNKSELVGEVVNTAVDAAPADSAADIAGASASAIAGSTTLTDAEKSALATTVGESAINAEPTAQAAIVAAVAAEFPNTQTQLEAYTPPTDDTDTDADGGDGTGTDTGPASPV